MSAPVPVDPRILDLPGTVLFDDRAPGRAAGTSYLLCDPLETIVAHQPGEVPSAIARLEAALAAGRYVAGFLGYDAGLGLDKPLRSRHSPAAPMVWLGVYRECRVFDAAAIDAGPADPVEAVQNVRTNIGRDAYLEAVRRVKQYIEAGDVYQINYTCKLRFENAGTPRGLFTRLRSAHPVCHSAWVNTGQLQVVSLSPELFLRIDGGQICTRPMKGTVRRGRWVEEDDAIARWLAADAKNRAENVMIVDLMRNDLGRLCRLASVEVRNPLAVERYRTVLQMTSEVAGRLRDGVSLGDVLRAAFPAGSVTGAPKLRALEIIDEVEHESRGVYCGSVGLFRPDGGCLLSVAIRTIVAQGSQCEMGVGSGIVADSDPAGEWVEVWLKGRFLEARPLDFELLETLRAGPGCRIDQADEHLARLLRSARYFGWEVSEERLRSSLEQAASKLTQESRLRLRCAEDGRVSVETSPLGPEPSGPVDVLLSTRRTDPSDVFLYHKTTHRAAYDADWQRARSQGFFDVLYCNARGELSEGAITNVIVELDGRQVTPAIRCGLLPGVWRSGKLSEGVEETIIKLEDLLRATRIMLGNSVRGDVEVAQIRDETGLIVWRREA